VLYQLLLCVLNLIGKHARLLCPAFPKQLPSRPERCKPYPLMPGQVVQRERDLILARRLWEAGEKAAGRDVVGVVGAGHVQVAVRHACSSASRVADSGGHDVVLKVIAWSPQGIAKNWGWAGSPEAARLVDELCTAPPANPNTSGTMITTGLIGWHACRC
jgi:hypothetical protein